MEIGDIRWAGMEREVRTDSRTLIHSVDQLSTLMSENYRKTEQLVAAEASTKSEVMALRRQVQQQNETTLKMGKKLEEIIKLLPGLTIVPHESEDEGEALTSRSTSRELLPCLDFPKSVKTLSLPGVFVEVFCHGWYKVLNRSSNGEKQNKTTKMLIKFSVECLLMSIYHLFQQKQSMVILLLLPAGFKVLKILSTTRFGPLFANF